MLTKIANTTRKTLNRTFRMITSPEVMITLTVVGTLVKLCLEINEYAKERRVIGFKK